MTLLKFSAVWCGPCKLMHKVMEDVFTEHPEYREKTGFTEIDVDDDPTDSSSAYGITNIPALVALSRDGEMLERMIGTHSKEDVIQFIERHVNL